MNTYTVDVKVGSPITIVADRVETGDGKLRFYRGDNEIMVIAKRQWEMIRYVDP